MAYSNKERDGRSSIEVVGQKPNLLSERERAGAITDAIAKLQEVEKAYIGADEVKIKVKHNEPLLVLNVGDLHIGSIATDHRAIFELRDFILSNPNILIVLSGDEIEGIKQAYLNTNTARTPLDLHMQIDYFKEIFLRPLVQAGRVLGMVSGYWGHPGWAEDATTINTWMVMTEGLNVPLIRNGGRIVLQNGRGDEAVINVFHNPPGKSPVEGGIYGLRNAAYGADESERADVYFSAHTHDLGAATENYAGAGKRINFVSSGTAKGSSDAAPWDRFGIKLGRPPADPICGGQGVIITWQKHEKNIYPLTNAAAQGELLQAVEDYDRLGPRLAGEAKEKYVLRAEPPKLLVVKDEVVYEKKAYSDEPGEAKQLSKYEVRRSSATGETLAPLYKVLPYDIRTDNWIFVSTDGNTRFGDDYEGYSEYLRYQKDFLEGNPYAFQILLRNLLDHDLATSPERLNILNRTVEMIKRMNGRVLALLKDSSGFSHEAWKRDIQVDKYQDEKGRTIKVYDPPVPPATFIANRAGVGLIHDGSEVILHVGPGSRLDKKPRYSVACYDTLKHHGSFSRPEFGLIRMYDLYKHRKPGVVVGGHMPNSGMIQVYDGSNQETHFPWMIANGHWAPVDKTGDVGGEPIQGFAVSPDGYNIVAIANKEHLYYVDALTTTHALIREGQLERWKRKR